jgi:RND family efflux transporter MFP subunit
MGLSSKSQASMAKTKGMPFLSRISKRTWWIISIVALLLISAGAYTYYKLVYSATSTTVTAAPLQTAVVRQGNLIIYASGNGTLVAANQATFSFGTSGQVTKVNARVGDLVKSGDVLAELDNSAQQIQYIQAKRTLTDMTSPYAIATAQVNITTAIKNVNIAHSQLAFLISPDILYLEEKIAEAQQALADAKAAATSAPSTDASNMVMKAEAILKYYQNQLIGTQYYYTTVYIPKYFTTKDKVTKVKTISAPSEASIASARAKLAQAKVSVIEAQNYLAAIKGELVPADASGTSLTAFENAQLALKTAEQNLASTQLIAPISGTLMAFSLTVGNKTDASTAATIADLSRPYLQIYLDPSDWSTVKVGKDAEITFDSLPDTKFTGKVTEVDPGLYASGNTSVIRAMVQLDVPPTGFNLPLGSTASVDVIGGQAVNALLIPIEALHPAGDQFTVFVMQNGKPTLRVVQVGIQDQVSAEILSGLQAGDIVTTGITGTKTQ